MKKIILLILIIFVFLFFYTISSAAIAPGAIPGDKDIISAGSPITEPNQLLTVIANIVKWTYAIFFIITVMFVLFAAFNYLTGGDDAEKIKNAHKQLLYAAVAVAVALLAVGFSLIIKQFLNPTNLSSSARTTQQSTDPFEGVIPF